MTTPRVQPFSRRVGMPPGAVSGRVYVAVLVVQLPLLAVLLTTQARSRVSSESVAGVLTVLLIGLVLAGLVISPAVCARVAPGGARWKAGSALSAVRALRRDSRRAYLRLLGE
ncbi:hypothetical protein [Streptomyces albidoflavus]|uniref:hypothetical protein n=1 Tax=Streptomyces albidoflavus TaxID=1886 RepID=UPI0033D8E87F